MVGTIVYPIYNSEDWVLSSSDDFDVSAASALFLRKSGGTCYGTNTFKSSSSGLNIVDSADNTKVVNFDLTNNPTASTIPIILNNGDLHYLPGNFSASSSLACGLDSYPSTYGPSSNKNIVQYGSSPAHYKINGTNTNIVMVGSKISSNSYTGVGANCVAIGSRSQEQGASGADNTSVGYWTMGTLNNASAGNTAVGSGAMYSSAGICNNNVAVGYTALGRNTVASSNNTAVGSGAAYNVLSGDNSIYLGYNSGPTTLSSSSNMLWIGDNTFASSNLTTSATLGGASSLPVAPQAYLSLYIGNTLFKTPIYNP